MGGLILYAYKKTRLMERNSIKRTLSLSSSILLHIDSLFCNVDDLRRGMQSIKGNKEQKHT